jgi:hypothetical protein
MRRRQQVASTGDAGGDPLTRASGRPALHPLPDARPGLWFVTLTVAGEPVGAEQVRRALERLSLERPFVTGARYCSDRAEVQYWEESEDVGGAIAQAMRMWSDHVVSAVLPAWHVVGLEVVDRQTVRARSGRREHHCVHPMGEIRPMEPPAGPERPLGG